MGVLEVPPTPDKHTNTWETVNIRDHKNVKRVLTFINPGSEEIQV